MDPLSIDAQRMTDLFEATGAHLESRGVTVSIVVVGGAALALRGWVPRTTQDIDVIALATGPERDLVAPVFPRSLVDAVARTARDFNLPPDWLNSVVGAQFKFGLPEGFEADIEWRAYRGLHVGLAGRSSLIALKLFAAVDSGLESVHCQDLLALAPTTEEMNRAGAWVRTQDRAQDWPRLVQEVIAHVGHRDRPGASG